MANVDLPRVNIVIHNVGAFTRSLAKTINLTNVLLTPRSVRFGSDTSPLVNQSREMTLILKTYP